MSVKGHNIRKATIKASPIFVCNDCGTTQMGDETTIESSSKDALYYVIHNDHASSNLMPVGWASYYNNVHRCPDCH